MCLNLLLAITERVRMRSWYQYSGTCILGTTPDFAVSIFLTIIIVTDVFSLQGFMLISFGITHITLITVVGWLVLNSALVGDFLP